VKDRTNLRSRASERIPLQKRAFWSGTPFWRDERFLRFAAQAIFLLLVIAALYALIENLFIALERIGLSFSFSFLREEAGFPISETTFLEYDPSRPFWYALLVGILNTLKVSVLGIILATLLGIVVGVARLSTNWLISRIALAYIEFHRNIPLLVYLFIWFFVAIQTLPSVQESIILPGPIVLNQRGIYLGWPRLGSGGYLFLALLVLGGLSASIVWFALRRLEEVSGSRAYKWPISMLFLLVISAAGWMFAGGQPLVVDVPVLDRFNYTGGLRLTPEFVALFIGLVLYTTAFIAEVVRSGIQAVSRGQVEAGLAIGLGNYQVLYLVVFPQALRVIIPPLISQYLNLAKNSSLAVAIGYFDVFFVGRTIINQAGRAIEVFLLIMAVYLTISLFTSIILNWYNRRIQFVSS
jgi:general L-amino acid transport system permease protein